MTPNKPAQEEKWCVCPGMVKNVLEDKDGLIHTGIDGCSKYLRPTTSQEGKKHCYHCASFFTIRGVHKESCPLYRPTTSQEFISADDKLPITPTSQEDSLEHLRKDTKYDMPAVLEATEKAGKVIRKHEQEDRTAQHWQGLSKGAPVEVGDTLGEVVRDITEIPYRSKSEVRRLIEGLLSTARAQGRAEAREMLDKKIEIPELQHEKWCDAVQGSRCTCNQDAAWWLIKELQEVKRLLEEDKKGV